MTTMNINGKQYDVIIGQVGQSVVIIVPFVGSENATKHARLFEGGLSCQS